MAAKREAKQEPEEAGARAVRRRSGPSEPVLPERHVRAVVLPCGTVGSFKGEVYQYERPVVASDGRSRPGLFFWIYRWLVDFLGGIASLNFIGRSREPIANRTAAVIYDGLSSSDEETQKMGKDDGDGEAIDMPSAEDHLTASSMMTRITQVKRKKSFGEGGVKTEVKAEVKEEPAEEDQDDVDDDGPISRGDFSLSSFALICWLAQLMAKGPRTNAKWNLDPADVKTRVTAFLAGMRDTFWQDVRKGCCHVVQGELLVQPLVKEHGQLVAKIFGKKEKLGVLEALTTLQADAGRRSLGMERRRLAEKVFSRLVGSLAEAIDDSAAKPLWTSTRVEALDQLRTRTSPSSVS